MKILSLLLFISLILFNARIINSKPLVDSDWLSKNSCNPNIIVIEVGNSLSSYKTQHIPCAIYTDFYKGGWRIKSGENHMIMPKVHDLENIIGQLGINESDYVIIYGKGEGNYNLAELTSIYFTFKYLGHRNISILDGGFESYIKKWDHDTDTGIRINNNKSYKSKVNYSILADKFDVLYNIKNKLTLVDSRETDYYLGINKLRNFPYYGTLVSSINLPSKWVAKDRGMSFNKIETISKIFSMNIIKNNNKPIFFCYAGLESSINWFIAHEILGFKEATLYEGSLFDWSVNYKNKSMKVLF